MLSELGADKQVINKSKQNAVHLAVSNKDVTLLRFLRDNDFNVNQEVRILSVARTNASVRPNLIYCMICFRRSPFRIRLVAKKS